MGGKHCVRTGYYRYFIYGLFSCVGTGLSCPTAVITIDWHSWQLKYFSCVHCPNSCSNSPASCSWQVEDPSLVLAHFRAGPVFVSPVYPSAQPPLAWVLPLSFPHSIMWHNVSQDPSLVVPPGQWCPLHYLHHASHGKNLFLPLPQSLCRGLAQFGLKKRKKKKGKNSKAPKYFLVWKNSIW